MNPLSDLLASLYAAAGREVGLWVARTACEYQPPSQPPRPTLTYLRKDTTTMALVFALKLPNEPGVAKYTLTETVNGTVTKDGVEATDGMELRYAPTDVLSLVITAFNAKGIPSGPSVPFTATASDLVPPATPASPSLTFLKEEADPVPTPTPEPTPAA